MIPWNAGRIRRFAPVAAGGLAIIGFLLVQDLQWDWLNALVLRLPGGDKIFHALEFFVVFIVVYRAAGTLTPRPIRQFAVSAVITLMLAVGDELGQGLSAGRNVELNDFIANLCGLTLGAVFLRGDWRTIVRACTAATALVVLTAVFFDSYETRKDFNRGQIYEREGQFGLARRAYLRALSAGLRSPALYNSLGWVEIESGEGTADKAVEYASKAVALRPEDPDVLDTYGWALHHAGRHEEALRYLLAAYAGKPKMFCIHYHLAMVYLAQGRQAEALEHLRAQVRVAPKADETRRAIVALEVLGYRPGHTETLQ